MDTNIRFNEFNCKENEYKKMFSATNFAVFNKKYMNYKIYTIKKTGGYRLRQIINGFGDAGTNHNGKLCHKFISFEQMEKHAENRCNLIKPLI